MSWHWGIHLQPSYWLVPAEYVHFFALSLISVSHKVVSQYINQFYFIQIWIAHDTIQSLNCEVGQVFIKINLYLLCKLTYSFVDVDSLGFTKNTDLNFYIS